MVKDGLAQALGLPINRIRVINAHTGGGFGSKNGLKPYHIIAAVLSQRTGRPVCLFMNREEEFIASHHRAKSRHIIRAGVKQDGILTSIYHRIIGQASPDPEGIRLAVAGADCTRHLYQCPHMKIELYKVLTNTQSPVPCRGPTAAEDLFCFEQFIDELAHMLKIEPLAFRLQNYAEIDPVDDRAYSSKGLKACYEQGAKAFGWEWRPPRTVREGSKYRGIGLGAVVFHGTPGEQSEAMVVLHNDGTAQVVAGIAEIGVGAETVFAQIAAEELGIPVEHVSVSYGDSQTTPYTINSSYGSRTTTIGGPAVRAAAFEAKRQLLVLAARELGVAPDTLTIKDAQNIVCLKKGGSTCWAVDGDNRYYHAILEGGPCYIVHPSDMAPALIALGAQMHILGPKGPRSLPLEEFFVTTVQRLYQENVLEREEIITALTVPSMSSEMKQVFLKSRIRQADEFSLAAVALAARVQAGTGIDCRVVLER